MEKNGSAIDVKEWTIDERVHSAGQKKEEEQMYNCGGEVIYISIFSWHQERGSLGKEKRQAAPLWNLYQTKAFF